MKTIPCNCAVGYHILDVSYIKKNKQTLSYVHAYHTPKMCIA